ncbi:MAG TPA: hypothetical protein VOA64_08120 [Candidatus Dormibacteraeota bacterium]|nr:hypothetical protein [Candidatus Dormibacteraeota bacterium]
MSDFSEQLTRYERKGREHLSRVRLSHVLALKTLQGVNSLLDEELKTDEELQGLVSKSFGSTTANKTKMRGILHDLHLVSLKANFELFLDRILVTIWKFHFDQLAAFIPPAVSLRAEKRYPHDDCNRRDFIIENEEVVPPHGLQLLEALTKVTNIHCKEVLSKSYWPQIFTAFQVRHLVEHCDGKVDKTFRMKVDKFWRDSSWGRRQSQSLSELKKVVTEKEDVDETYAAMWESTELLSKEVLKWSSDHENLR